MKESPYMHRPRLQGPVNPRGNFDYTRLRGANPNNLPMQPPIMSHIPNLPFVNNGTVWLPNTLQMNSNVTGVSGINSIYTNIQNIYSGAPIPTDFTSFPPMFVPPMNQNNAFMPPNLNMMMPYPNLPMPMSTMPESSTAHQPPISDILRLPSPPPFPKLQAKKSHPFDYQPEDVPKPCPPPLPVEPPKDINIPKPPPLPVDTDIPKEPPLPASSNQRHQLINQHMDDINELDDDSDLPLDQMEKSKLLSLLKNLIKKNNENNSKDEITSPSSITESKIDRKTILNSDKLPSVLKALANDYTDMMADQEIIHKLEQEPNNQIELDGISDASSDSLESPYYKKLDSISSRTKNSPKLLKKEKKHKKNKDNERKFQMHIKGKKSTLISNKKLTSDNDEESIEYQPVLPFQFEVEEFSLRKPELLHKTSIDGFALKDLEANNKLDEIDLTEKQVHKKYQLKSISTKKKSVVLDKYIDGIPIEFDEDVIPLDCDNVDGIPLESDDDVIPLECDDIDVIPLESKMKNNMTRHNIKERKILKDQSNKIERETKYEKCLSKLSEIKCKDDIEVLSKDTRANKEHLIENSKSKIDKSDLYDPFEEILYSDSENVEENINSSSKQVDFNENDNFKKSTEPNYRISSHYENLEFDDDIHEIANVNSIFKADIDISEFNHRKKEPKKKRHFCKKSKCKKKHDHDFTMLSREPSVELDAERILEKSLPMTLEREAPLPSTSLMLRLGLSLSEQQSTSISVDEKLPEHNMEVDLINEEEGPTNEESRDNTMSSINDLAKKDFCTNNTIQSEQNSSIQSIDNKETFANVEVDKSEENSLNLHNKNKKTILKTDAKDISDKSCDTDTVFTCMGTNVFVKEKNKNLSDNTSKLHDIKSTKILPSINEEEKLNKIIREKLENTINKVIHQNNDKTKDKLDSKLINCSSTPESKAENYDPYLDEFINLTPKDMSFSETNASSPESDFNPFDNLSPFKITSKSNNGPNLLDKTVDKDGVSLDERIKRMLDLKNYCSSPVKKPEDVKKSEDPKPELTPRRKKKQLGYPPSPFLSKEIFHYWYRETVNLRFYKNEKPIEFCDPTKKFNHPQKQIINKKDIAKRKLNFMECSTQDKFVPSVSETVCLKLNQKEDMEIVSNYKQRTEKLPLMHKEATYERNFIPAQYKLNDLNCDEIVNSVMSQFVTNLKSSLKRDMKRKLESDGDKHLKRFKPSMFS